MRRTSLRPGFLFLASGLLLFQIGCNDLFGQKEVSPSDRAQLPLKFSFRISDDPGHGGGSKSWDLERKQAKYIVTLTESRYSPRPGEKDFKPEFTSRTEARSAEETERFLFVLVHDLKIEELKTLETRILLHPTTYYFDLTFPGGRVHQFQYRIEAGNHLDRRYRRVVEECLKFFRADQAAP